MRTLTLEEKNYPIPGTWNELTAEQLLYLTKLVNKKISAEEIKLKMLLKVLNARVYSYIHTDSKMYFTIKVGKRKYDLSAEELQPVTGIFDYLFIRIENINDLTKKEMVKKSLLYDALYTMEIAAENFEEMNRKMKK